MSAYADTSFLVSLYTPDANSLAAAKAMRLARVPILITALGELELLNALHLRLFRRELDAGEIKSAASLFREDLDSAIYSLKPISLTTYERAKQIVRKRTSSLGTRTLAILHVASALVLRADTFYTFDKDQRELAVAEGFKTPV